MRVTFRDTERVHADPRATEKEQEQGPERIEDEEAMRGPASADPELPAEKAGDGDDE